MRVVLAIRDRWRVLDLDRIVRGGKGALRLPLTGHGGPALHGASSA